MGSINTTEKIGEQEKMQKINKWERILEFLSNTVFCNIQTNASFFLHPLCFFKKTRKGKTQLWTWADIQ